MQNLFSCWPRPNQANAIEALRGLGVSIEEVVIGPDGLTASRRALVKAVAAIMSRVARVAGYGSKEWDRAISAVITLSGDVLDRATAHALLRDAKPSDLDATKFDNDDRFILLRYAVEVAAADGHLSAEEGVELRRLAAELGLPSTALDSLMQMLVGDHGDSPRERQKLRDYLEACGVLGVSPNACAADIRGAYKQMMLTYHPDRVDRSEREAATRRATEINLAYEFLIGARVG